MKPMLTSDNLLPIAQENAIVEIQHQLTQLKQKEKILKEALASEMEKRNIKKIDTNKLSITFVEATTKETFDTTSFKEQYRDLYDDFVKISDVKSYVKIKIKDGKLEN